MSRQQAARSIVVHRGRGRSKGGGKGRGRQADVPVLADAEDVEEAHSLLHMLEAEAVLNDDGGDDFIAWEEHLSEPLDSVEDFMAASDIARTVDVHVFNEGAAPFQYPLEALIEEIMNTEDGHVHGFLATDHMCLASS